MAPSSGLTRTIVVIAGAIVTVLGAYVTGVADPENSGSYQLHLEDRVRFNPIQPGADAVRGQALFGLATDDNSQDTSRALFQGPSLAAGRVIVSNGRTCFTCHRGVNEQLGLPVPPLSASVPLTDTLFTGLDADAQHDPDGFANLDERGLVKYRPNRFNPTRTQDDPFRQVFAWRKSVRLVNTGLMHGFLNDARARVMFETARGAVFSHTQEGDARFDDLFALQDGKDMEAFLFGLKTLSDPRLAALRDPSHPLYQTLVDNPFHTVSLTTPAQGRGQQVFERFCFSCHNTPNVFTNLSNVEPLANGDRPVNFPAFAPSVARTFNIGVSERNRHGLRFTRFVPETGGFAPIVMELAAENGETVPHEVQFDIGLAMTTGRYEDIGRFKVPQLRGLSRNAPYFHDNSAATIEEVVDYFNSDAYNRSRDGRRFPIRLTPREREHLIEFLKAL